MLEKNAIQQRMQLLTTFETAVKSIDSSNDINLFIDQYKKPEHVHKSMMALTLLEEEHKRRYVQPDKIIY